MTRTIRDLQAGCPLIVIGEMELLVTISYSIPRRGYLIPMFVFGAINTLHNEFRWEQSLYGIRSGDSQLGTFLSDGELAWESRGMGVYIYPYVWHGFDRQGERSGVLHPTQKPTALMVWCLSRFPEARLTLDPFMGSGTTLRAAKELNRKAIGIEIEERYCEIAAKRCESIQAGLFDTPVVSVAREPQTGLFGE